MNICSRHATLMETGKANVKKNTFVKHSKAAKDHIIQRRVSVSMDATENGEKPSGSIDSLDWETVITVFTFSRFLTLSCLGANTAKRAVDLCKKFDAQ